MSIHEEIDQLMVDRKAYLNNLGNRIRNCYDVNKDRDGIEKLRMVMGDDVVTALEVTAEDNIDPYYRW